MNWDRVARGESVPGERTAGPPDPARPPVRVLPPSAKRSAREHPQAPCGHAIALLCLFCCLIPGRAAEEPSLQTRPRPGDPHEHLRRILERPLYQRWRLRQERAYIEHEVPYASFLKRVLKAVFRFIGKLIEKLARFLMRLNPGLSLPSMSGVGRFFKNIGPVGIVVLGGALYLMVFLRFLRRKRKRSSTARILSRRQARNALESGEALAMTGSGWLQEADRLTEEGEFRSVYRALYLALLSGLHAAGKINFRKNRTNWTYVRRFHGPAPEQDTFSSLTRLFDRVWYGHKPPEDTPIESIRYRVENLLAEEALDG